MYEVLRGRLSGIRYTMYLDVSRPGLGAGTDTGVGPRIRIAMTHVLSNR